MILFIISVVILLLCKLQYKRDSIISACSKSFNLFLSFIFLLLFTVISKPKCTTILSGHDSAAPVRVLSYSHCYGAKGFINRLYASEIILLYQKYMASQSPYYTARSLPLTNAKLKHHASCT